MASWTALLFRVLMLRAALSAAAWGYIDPGAGLVLWLGTIALIGALILFVRQPWSSLKKLTHYLPAKFKQ